MILWGLDFYLRRYFQILFFGLFLQSWKCSENMEATECNGIIQGRLYFNVETFLLVILQNILEDLRPTLKESLKDPYMVK